MTSYLPATPVTRAFTLLVVLSISPVTLAADEACTAQWVKSSASNSCTAPKIREYETGSCEIRVLCQQANGSPGHTANLIYRKLDTVSELSNNNGYLRGGAEAKPPQ